MRLSREGADENGRRRSFQPRTLKEAIGDVRTWPEVAARSVEHVRDEREKFAPMR
jgi:hypothetical protein